MVVYVSMQPKEAKALLETFVARTPQRLEEFRAQVAASGGLAAAEPDLTPASLVPLWEWAAPRFTWRAGYTPPPDGEPGDRYPKGPLEPDDELPEWFDARAGDSWRFSAQTLWLSDGLARYLGECLVAHVPGTRWTVAQLRKGYVYQNHIVIAGLANGEIEPMWAVTTLASRAMQPNSIYTQGPRTLAAVYELCVTPAVRHDGS